MFNWLSYGNDPQKGTKGVDKEFFSCREWSFTIEDDIYIRYQSYKDKDEFTAAIQKRQPHKIDIGAVFTAPPKDHTTIKPDKFHPVERELVFDIDMTDYDDVRTCCKEADICHRCWPFMTMAIKVVDKALRADFNFQHILWIYSGRRGVHCWVCDPCARELSNEARSAVVDYLSVHVKEQGDSEKRKKNLFSQPHPMLRRAYEQLEPYFAQKIADGKGQGLLATKKSYMKILNELPSDVIRKDLYDAWESNESLSGFERWKQIKAATTAQNNESNAQAKKRKINYADLENWRYELVFKYCYPRLDANVSKTQNHLLKSPFCVHPKTGRICIPIDPANADKFDPFTVPTVRTLCAEVSNRNNPLNCSYSYSQPYTYSISVTCYSKFTPTPNSNITIYCIIVRSTSMIRAI